MSHTPTPWIDNVKITRYESLGPQWHYRSIDLFQDNFAGEPGGTVRADAAIDIEDIDAVDIEPRDFIVVTCDAPNAGGLDTLNGTSRVYMHVRALWIGPGTQPNLAGSSLAARRGTVTRSVRGAETRVHHVCLVRGASGSIGSGPSRTVGVHPPEIFGSRVAVDTS